MFDVAVIGAGVSGAAIARLLAAHAVTVALVERAADVSFGVSKANSGIIHAAFHHKGTTLKARLEAAGNPMFDRLQAELGFPFRRVGIVVAAFSEEEMKTVEVLHERGVENGSPGIEIVGRDRLLALEPKLSPDVRGGLFAPSGGIIEPYRFVFSLVENAVANGVQLFRNWKASSAHQVDGGWQIESDRDERILARWVVNAAGLRADEVSAAFGAERYTITPRKGEEYILERGSAGFPSRVIFPVPTKNSKGMLVIPTVEGTMMLGPTAEEIEDKSDVATTPDNLERVFDLAARMVPAVSRRDIITSFAGLRPTLPGDDFYVERSREAPRFVQVAGIQSPGPHGLARHRRARAGPAAGRWPRASAAGGLRPLRATPRAHPRGAAGGPGGTRPPGGRGPFARSRGLQVRDGERGRGGRGDQEGPHDAGRDQVLHARGPGQVPGRVLHLPDHADPGARDGHAPGGNHQEGRGERARGGAHRRRPAADPSAGPGRPA